MRPIRRIALPSAFLIACSADPAPGATSTLETDAGATSGGLAVLSYNVHGLPPQITGDDTDARLDAIGPLLDGWDVVGLQEDFDDDRHARMVAHTAYPSRSRFSAKVDPARAYGSGLSVLANASIEATHEVHFTDCYGILDGASDCLASKGFQAIRLALGPGASVDVYNSHLEAGGGPDDERAREAHVDQLIDAMNDWSAGHAVIFLGDTNLHGRDAIDAALVARWLDEAGLTELCDAVSCPEPGRIDRILYRNGDAVALEPVAWEVAPGFVDAAGTPLSDHDPISGTLDWRLTDPR